MTIQFYLNDNEETHIYTMYDMVSNPFKEGDIINLSVAEIPPTKYANYEKSFQKVMIEKNQKLHKLFNMKEIKLVREAKYIDLEKYTLVIEYFCNIITLEPH